MKLLFSIFLGIILLSSCSKNTKPDLASNPYPADDTTDVVDSVLRWQGNDIDGDVLTYDIMIMKIIENRTEFVNFEYKYELDTFVIQNIENNTKYIWSIKTRDGRSKRNGSVWSFTTGKIH